jgi:hypothetical protein
VKQIRQRLTYANVVSTLALFLVVGGATAIAAKKLPKHSVGPRELKANAVRTAKIKANAVTTRKIKKNAITTVKIKDNAVETAKLDDSAVTAAKIANGSVTGAKIDVASTPFGRIVQESRGSSTKGLDETLAVYPLQDNAYTQPAGRDDTYIGQIEVVIPASCAGIRKVTVGLLVDPVDLTTFTAKDFIASRDLEETSSEPRTARISLGPAASFQPPKATTHSLYLAAVASCETGGGVTATSGGIDVIGTE